MSPYRKDGAPAPSDGLSATEREARDRRDRRRRTVAMAVGIPLALASVAFVLGLLLELTGSSAAGRETAAQTATPARSQEEVVLDAASKRRAHGPALGTVGDYCNEPCPTQAEDWARVRAGREPPTWCMVGNRAGPCNRVETGTCGALGYVKVDVDPTCGGSTRYFDDAGAMVGVVNVAPLHTMSDDGAFHDPIAERTYGHIPECELVPSESLCVKPLQ